MSFDIQCRRCPRLATFLDDVKAKWPDYHARPVPPFGATDARLLIVGLAPGLHGANASGRPFTGDFAGIILYKLLYEYHFSNKPESLSGDDGLVLENCRITNAVKCLPPQNKPSGEEIRECNRYLDRELAALAQGSVVLALGTIAHQAVVRAMGAKLSSFAFGHGNRHALPNNNLWLVDSYHCSRYNTQTRRLTERMFRDIFDQISELLTQK